MSGWEIFTWFNVGVLSVGSVIVFVLFLRRRRELIPPRSRDEKNPNAGDPI